MGHRTGVANAPRDGTASRQFRGDEVRAPRHQAPFQADPALPAGTGRPHRGPPRRRELHRRRDRGQVLLAPAAVPPGSAPARCRLQTQPPLADAARCAGRAAPRADLRGAAEVHHRQPRHGDGRDADQGSRASTSSSTGSNASSSARGCCPARNPSTKALAYVRVRRAGLAVFPPASKYLSPR